LNSVRSGRYKPRLSPGQCPEAEIQGKNEGSRREAGQQSHALPIESMNATDLARMNAIGASVLLIEASTENAYLQRIFPP